MQKNNQRYSIECIHMGQERTETTLIQKKNSFNFFKTGSDAAVVAF